MNLGTVRTPSNCCGSPGVEEGKEGGITLRPVVSLVFRAVDDLAMMGSGLGFNGAGLSSGSADENVFGWTLSGLAAGVGDCTGVSVN